MAKKKGKKGSHPAAAAKPPQASHVRDANVIGHDATTRAERRAVLVSALANEWATADIDTVERVDEGNFHGWAMWPFI